MLPSPLCGIFYLRNLPLKFGQNWGNDRQIVCFVVVVVIVAVVAVVIVVVVHVAVIIVVADPTNLPLNFGYNRVRNS